jgi:hypothetical protein
MDAPIETYKSQNFQNDVNALSFKENNFTFKLTRALVEMFKSGSNFSHLVKVEKAGFEKPLFVQKIQKDLRVLLILEEFSSPTAYKVTFLRAFRVHQLDETLETLDETEAYSAFNFNDFWV